MGPRRPKAERKNQYEMQADHFVIPAKPERPASENSFILATVSCQIEIQFGDFSKMST